jgi:uncharacterized protein (TIGR02246 family)
MSVVLERPPASATEREIRGLIADWAQALAARDLDALLANYADDVLLFDVKPPFRLRGVAAYRAMWAACLPYFPARFAIEHRDLEITATPDAAFAHGLVQIRPIGAESPAGQTWLRATICYARVGGAWRVVHEHVSVPFDPTTGQAVFISDPDEAGAPAPGCVAGVAP